jgi:hypothetical protein
MTSANTKRIIFYYQTFKGLSNILYLGTPVTDIHLSSIHFGNNQDGTPYIHLNDYPPDYWAFDSVWDELKMAHEFGVRIKLMVGGAGGAFTNLFGNFDVYYPMLKKTIQDHSIISGIDLDIEEGVQLDNVIMLMKKLNNDFPNLEFALAPLGSSLESDVLGMGGFCYKDLYNSEVGHLISYFNGQFYGSYQPSDYISCVNNNYPPEKVVMGMLEGQDLNQAYNTISDLAEKYSNFGGVFFWEYFQAPDNWAEMVDCIMYQDRYVLLDLDSELRKCVEDVEIVDTSEHKLSKRNFRTLIGNIRSRMASWGRQVLSF